MNYTFILLVFLIPCAYCTCFYDETYYCKYLTPCENVDYFDTYVSVDNIGLKPRYHTDLQRASVKTDHPEDATRVDLQRAAANADNSKAKIAEQSKTDRNEVTLQVYVDEVLNFTCRGHYCSYSYNSNHETNVTKHTFRVNVYTTCSSGNWPFLHIYGENIEHHNNVVESINIVMYFIILLCVFSGCIIFIGYFIIKCGGGIINYCGSIYKRCLQYRKINNGLEELQNEVFNL